MALAAKASEPTPPSAVVVSSDDSKKSKKKKKDSQVNVLTKAAKSPSPVSLNGLASSVTHSLDAEEEQQSELSAVNHPVEWAEPIESEPAEMADGSVTYYEENLPPPAAAAVAQQLPQEESDIDEDFILNLLEMGFSDSLIRYALTQTRKAQQLVEILGLLTSAPIVPEADAFPQIQEVPSPAIAYVPYDPATQYYVAQPQPRPQAPHMIPVIVQQPQHYMPAYQYPVIPASVPQYSYPVAQRTQTRYYPPAAGIPTAYRPQVAAAPAVVQPVMQPVMQPTARPATRPYRPPQTFQSAPSGLPQSQVCGSSFLFLFLWAHFVWLRAWQLSRCMRRCSNMPLAPKLLLPVFKVGLETETGKE